jgi:hypothetical protein
MPARVAAAMGASYHNMCMDVVAEQFRRRPSEQLKLALMCSGLFGTVYSSFNDFAGHCYHGIELNARRQGRSAAPRRS